MLQIVRTRPFKKDGKKLRSTSFDLGRLAEMVRRLQKKGGKSVGPIFHA